MNVFVSALITPGGLPDQLLQRWEAGDFIVVTSSEQLDEVKRVFGYEKLQPYISADQATRLLASLSHSAEKSETLPPIDASTDPSDNLILATAIAGNASHLITGDIGDLLSLKQVAGVSIISVREAIQLLDSETKRPAT